MTLADRLSTPGQVAAGLALAALAVGGGWVAATRLPSVVGVAGALAAAAGSALVLIVFIESVGARARERDERRRREMREDGEE